MEKSKNYNFNLPNSANDEIADINDISDNFRTIDKIMKETDQTFKPTSTKAASGKAVAEAVSTEKNRANNTFANALKGSKSGAAFLISDVSPVTHDMGVKVRGKNLIPYPYTKTGTYTINDVTFETNSDNTITVNGTASADIYNWIVTNNSLTYGFSGTVTLSGCPSGGSTQTYYFTEGHDLYDSGSGATGNMYQGALGFCIVIMKDTVCDNLIFKPQLELGTTATTYAPYVPDLTAVKVSRCGKNLFDINGFINLTGNSTYYGINDNGELYVKQSDYRDDTVIPAFITLEAGTYTLSSTTAITSSFKLINLTDNKVIAFNNNITFSIEKVTSLVIKCYQSADTVIGKLQLELGSTATDYEPYKECAEYTPTADGTVEGVTSLYPNTTLTTDTDGVIIECEYNKDINKAFAELQQAIISLGGNV